jgi:ActR/RegA family two-component response regulator
MYATDENEEALRDRSDMRATLHWTHDAMAPASALIIDPVLSDVMFSVATATSLGFRVTVADSFQEALERLRVPPALLIADIRLGEYNGLHLVLRGKAARRDLAAIVTSGMADLALQAEAERLGATFVLKPTTAREFSAAICRTLLQGPDSPGGPIRSPFERRASDRRSTPPGAHHPERRKGSRRRDVVQLIQQVVPT